MPSPTYSRKLLVCGSEAPSRPVSVGQTFGQRATSAVTHVRMPYHRHSECGREHHHHVVFRRYTLIGAAPDRTVLLGVVAALQDSVCHLLPVTLHASPAAWGVSRYPRHKFENWWGTEFAGISFDHCDDVGAVANGKTMTTNVW